MNKSLEIPEGILYCEGWNFGKTHVPMRPVIVLNGISSRTVNSKGQLKEWVDCYIAQYVDVIVADIQYLDAMPIHVNDKNPIPCHCYVIIKRDLSFNFIIDTFLILR